MTHTVVVLHSSNIIPIPSMFMQKPQRPDADDNSNNSITGKTLL